MTSVELLLQTMDIETPMTRRILERVPEGLPDWTPHAKSMPLGKLAMHVATLPRMATVCLTTDSFDLAGQPSADPSDQSTAQLLLTFDGNAAMAREALAAATDEHLHAPWQLKLGDRVITDEPRALVLNHMFLGHLIHHRAQLGMYLRLNDLTVPGVYGPSADDLR